MDPPKYSPSVCNPEPGIGSQSGSELPNPEPEPDPKPQPEPESVPDLAPPLDLDLDSDCDSEPGAFHRVPFNNNKAATLYSQVMGMDHDVIGYGKILQRAASDFAIRLWLIDNSGSMCQIVEGDDAKKSNWNWCWCFPTTTTPNPPNNKKKRWDLLCESIKRQANLAHECAILTRFVFLNPPSNGAPRSITVGHTDREESLIGMRKLRASLRATPQGQTPLCAALSDVVDLIHCTDKRVVVVIATDGMATDGSVFEHMKWFEGDIASQVWTIIRLCDADSQPQLRAEWEKIDQELELNIDIIGDDENEARLVESLNPITYDIGLHTLRLLGSTEKLLDLINEMPCNPLSLKRLLLFDGNDEDEECTQDNHIPHTLSICGTMGPLIY